MSGVQIHGKELLKVQVQGQPRNLVVLKGTGSTWLFHAHPLVDRFNAEHGTRLTVVSHNVADVALTTGETWRSLPAFAVDAFIAYEKPGTRLGKEIVVPAGADPRLVLETGSYQGEKDVALVALGLSSTDFGRDGNSFVFNISESRLILVPGFPGSDGQYRLHAGTGIPYGVEVRSSDARRLLRYSSSYVGLLVRDGGNGRNDRNNWHTRTDVCAFYRHSYGLGVVAEVPDTDVAKIDALLADSTHMRTAAKTAVEPVSTECNRPPPPAGSCCYCSRGWSE